MHFPILCFTSDSHRGLRVAVAGVSVEAYRLRACTACRHFWRGAEKAAPEGINARISCSYGLSCSSPPQYTAWSKKYSTCVGVNSCERRWMMKHPLGLRFDFRGVCGDWIGRDGGVILTATFVVQ